jgi:hypothetical protein
MPLGPTLNVQVSRDGFSLHAEPYLAVNPRNPSNLLGACTVFDGSHRGFATYSSFDGGQTWQGNGMLAGPAQLYYANVTVTFDGHGRGFVCGWVGDRQHPEGGGALVWRSDDGGRTVVDPLTAAAGFLDHPTLSADRATGPAPSVLYLAGYLDATPGGLAFCRSTDGGRTFERLRFIDRQTGSLGRLPLIASGSNGTVAIAYLIEDRDSRMAVISSTDHGKTFGMPSKLATVNQDLTAGITTRGGPAVAVAPSGGRVYAAVVTYNTTIGQSELLLFSSHDHGRTWGPPVTVAASRQAHYMQPQLSVTPNGRAGLSIFEFSNGRVNVLLFISDGQSGRFGQPLLVTSSSFDPSLSGAGGKGWLGDYQGLTYTAGHFHPFWNDARTGQMEIFTAKVPVA